MTNPGINAFSGLHRLTSIAITLFLAMPLFAAERDLVLDPMQPGPYAVGSTNFKISDTALNSVLSQGGSAGDYQEGDSVNGQLLYISTLLENPDDAFSFDVTVPEDSTLYGESAGQTIPFAGYVLYPTTASNVREDYVVFTGPALPKMQPGSEGPIFENDSTLYPLIVYSHGVGSHPSDTVLTYLKDLASHGYIVMALYHGDGRWGETEARRFNLRPLAVKKAIDDLLADEDFSGHIDTDRIGGMGESFGGATMLALLGAKVVNPDVASVVSNTLLDVQTDPRIKAAATYVPYMGAGLYSIFGANGTGAAGVTRPFMANSGTADTVAEYDKVQAVFNNLGGVRYLVAYQGEGHDFTDGANSDVSTWMKLFMDAYVKLDSQAINDLSRARSVNDSGDDSLAVAVTSPTSPDADPVPQPDPLAEPAVFAANVLSIPSVNVDNQTFMVTLTLQSAEPPYVFALTGASDVATPAAASATFNSATGELDIADVQVEGVSYRILMSLSSQDPIQFTLTSATEN